MDETGWSARDNAEADVPVEPGETVEVELRLRTVVR
jgi:hypothetical protein